jgi:hypothetical protein
MVPDNFGDYLELSIIGNAPFAAVFLTPNTIVIYILVQIDLSDGPVVMNAPPRCLG